MASSSCPRQLFPAYSRAVGPQLSSYRDIGIRRVLAEHEVQLVVAAGWCVYPLAAQNGCGDNVGVWALAPLEAADRSFYVQGADRFGKGRLVLGVGCGLQRSRGCVEQRQARAELLGPLFAEGVLVPSGEILGRDVRQGRGVWEGRSPVRAAGEADPDGAESFHLGREQAGLRDLRDLGFVALLDGLLPKGDKVRRDGERIEDFALLGLEFGDLRGVVVRPIGVGARIDNEVALLGQQGAQFPPDGVAVGVVRPHHADFLVGWDLGPEVGVGEVELLDAEAKVIGVLEGVLLAGFGASAVVPRFPRHDGGDARHTSSFARVGHGIDRFRCGCGEHQVDTVAVDQVVGDLRAALRVRLAVFVDDLHVVCLAADGQATGEGLAREP